MPVRHLLVIPIFAWVLFRTFRSPSFGTLSLLAVVIIPPQGLFWGFNEWHIPLVTGAILLLSTFAHWHNRTTRVTPNLQFLLAGLVLFFLFLSSVFSANPTHSFEVFIDFWVKTFILAFLVYAWIQSKEDFQNTLWLIVVCLGLLAFRGVYRYAVGYEELTGILNSTMGDRNDFAMHLMMAAPLALSLLRSTSNRAHRLLLQVTLGLLMSCTILTYSRMGFLLLLVFLVMMVSYSRHKLAVFAAILLVAFLAGLMLPDSYQTRMQTITEYDEDASALGRLNAWKYGWRMIRDNPLFGVGLRCFALPEVYLRYADDQNPHVAHNAYIQVAADSGIPAFVVWLLLILRSMWAAFSVSRRCPDQQLQLHAAALGCSHVIYLVAATFLSAPDRELLFVIVALSLSASRLSVLREHPNRPTANTRIAEPVKKNETVGR